MSSSIAELTERLSGLKVLAGRLQADPRSPGTALKEDAAADPLISSAQKLKVPLLAPLTIGTLLASVLGEMDCDENALKSLAHHQTGKNN